MDPHRRSERRSLRYHRVIAQRLAREPELLESARARVERWLRDASVAREYALLWQRALSAPLDALTTLLTDDSEHARSMRQVTPFAGALGARERWRLWAQERA